MNVLVTGGSGMLGKALQEIMPDAKYVSSRDYDLTVQDDVNKMFRYVRPDVVIHLAALVSGIQDNINRPADHFEDNILMNSFMVQTAHKFNTPHFIGMLSTCIYPDTSLIYPLTENDIHSGPPTETNFSYAYAKRAMAVQIDACNKQHGTNYSYLIPANIFGKEDKFDEGRSHFMGALIRKIYEANRDGQDSITLYGTGKPLRQYIHAADVAKIIKYCVENEVYKNMNVAPDEEYSIKELAIAALQACDCNVMGIEFDESKPDGQYQKTVSNQVLRSVIPDLEFTPLKTGIKQVFEHYSGTQAQ